MVFCFLFLNNSYTVLLQPVTLVSDISDKTTQASKEATFECVIKINYPEISLTWYKDTKKLSTDSKYEVKVSGDHHTLKIKDCQSSDQGNYRVVCGPHISSAKLTVTGKCCLDLIFIFFVSALEIVH